jgi:hypothetical protein
MKVQRSSMPALTAMKATAFERLCDEQYPGVEL